MDAVEQYRKRREIRMDVRDYHRRAEERKNKNNVKKILDNFKQSGIINLDDEEADVERFHGNTRIPYGLCKSAGINTEGMTPSEAWEALQGKLGITPSDVYKELKERGTVAHIPKEKEYSESKEDKPDSPTGAEPKIAFDDPESVELYKRLKAGDYLPIDELLEHPAVKKLHKLSADYSKRYGETKYIDTPERNKLRRKVKYNYLKTGSARVSEKDGKRTVEYNGPLKKEFKACLVLGRPAAGKSSRIVEPYSERHGAFVLDPDRLSEEWPEYRETNGGAAACVHTESQKMLKDILWREFCKEGPMHGTNIVYPFVGGYLPYVEKTIKMLEDAGYRVQVKYQDATPEESANRMVMRGLETGRITPMRKESGGTPEETMRAVRKMSGGKYVKSRRSKRTV